MYRGVNVGIFAKLSFAGLISACAFAGNALAGDGAARQKEIAGVIDSAIAPLLKQYAIPGMAVAVTLNGESYFYNYGVSSLESKQPVTNQTLFEIGSNSKPFAATLASYAQVTGKLSLNDKVTKYLPALKGSSFDHVSLLNLGTYTAGGLPLQVPDQIQNNEQLMAYLKAWSAPYAPDTRRAYSNVSIGLLGMIAARSMNVSYDDALEKQLLPMLGMKHSYIHVPPDQMAHYAQGYTKQGQPVRVSPGVLSSEAYGIKTGSADMIRFVAANMGGLKLDSQLQQAIDATHIGYFNTGEMTQALIWERYPYPLTVKQILAGNADTMAYDAKKVTPLNPPLAQHNAALFNKTGSTNGFASYVAYVPEHKIGVVMLANKNFPIPARVTAAYQIIDQLNAKN